MYISQQDFLLYYQGQVQNVRVRAENGKTIEMPASHFRPFVSSLGIRGRFRLTLQKNGKFVSLEKIN